MSEIFEVINKTFPVHDDKFSEFISTLKSKCRINSYKYSYTYEKNKDNIYHIVVTFTETRNSHNRNNQFDDIMYPLSFLCE